jgi:hypothetical protein
VVGLGAAGHQPRAAPQPHPHEAPPAHVAAVRPHLRFFRLARSLTTYVGTFVVAPHISSIVRFVSALSLSLRQSQVARAGI